MMKKRTISILLAGSILISFSASGSQDNAAPVIKGNWKLSGVTGLNMLQTGLKNWSLGGENSFNGSLYLFSKADYIVDKIAWENAFNTQYGKTYTETNKWYKNLDNINLSTKFGYALTESKKLYLTALADFTTQYDLGYAEPLDPDSAIVSKWFAPAYLNMGIGLDYKPYSWFSLFYSPASTRLTFVENDYLASFDLFGIGTNEKFKALFGMYLRAAVDVNIRENINIKSILDLYTPYDNTFGNIIVDWNFLLTAKITKFINFTFNILLKYDDRLKILDKDGIKRPKVQLKESMGLGIAYNF